MSIRRMTLLVVGLTFLGLVLVLTLTLQGTLGSYFAREESLSVLQSLQRVKTAYDNEFAFLDQTARDWAKWDDTYDFVESLSDTYITANLADQTFIDLDINLLVFVNERGQPVYAKEYDLETGVVHEVAPDLLAYIRPGDPLITFADGQHGKMGVLPLSRGPLLIVAHPIFPTSGEGPARGVLLLGRYMTLRQIERLSQVVHLPLQFIYAQQPDLSETQRAVFAELESGQTYVTHAVDEDTVEGFLPVRDFYGNLNYVLRIEEARAFYRNGRLMLDYMTLGLVASGAIFGLMMMALLESQVVSPITRLSEEVQAIARSGNVHERVDSGSVKAWRNNEFGVLSRNINAMLETLEQAQNLREASEARFRTLVESMDDVVLTLDTQQRIIDAFGRGVERSGLRSRVSAGQDLPTQTDAQAQRLHRQAFQAAIQGETQVYEWVSRSQGEQRHFQTSLSPMRNSQGEVIGVVSVGRDITRLKQLEMVLRQRVEELAALHEVSQVFLSELSPATILVDICNLAVGKLGLRAAWVGMVGANPAQIKPVVAQGMDLCTLYPVSLDENPDIPLARVARTRQPLTVCAAESGAILPSDIRADCCPTFIVPLAYGKQVAVLSLIGQADQEMSDERMQMLQAFTNLAHLALQNATLFDAVNSGRKRLQDLSRQLVDVQETERRQIALELHDEIGQVLTGLKLMLDVGVTLPAEKMAEQVRKSQQLVNDLIGRVRQLSLDLRPAMLDDLGLLPALLWLIGRYSGQTQIKVDFQHSNIEGRRFPPQLEITAFRVIQEALTNAARYSGAQQVQARVWFSGQVLGLQVEDAGIGFDVDAVLARGASSGLPGMRERIGLIGGQFNMDSAPGMGTCLTVRLPLSGYLERREDERIDPAGG